MKNVNTLLSEAAELLNEDFYRDEEISNGWKLFAGSKYLGTFENTRERDALIEKYEAKNKNSDKSDVKNKTLTESIDKLMSIVETVEFNMIYESLTEATTEEDVAKKENKLKVAKDTIVKAVKKIIEIIEQKIQDLYNIVMTKFKSDHLVVSEDTVVYDINFSALYNIVNNDDETKYLYAIKYAEGKKIAKSKILIHIKKYKIYISDYKKLLNNAKKDLTEAAMNAIRVRIRTYTKSIDSYYKLLRNTKADEEVKETKE